MPPLLCSSDNSYRLGVSSMDSTHDEFISLVNKLAIVDKYRFMQMFGDLVAHTREHFENENRLMQETGFPAIREHMDEHQRVLGDLERLGKRVASGNVTMGRAYVMEQMPDWFDLHAKTMDSALAAHIKRSELNTISIPISILPAV